MVSTSRICLTFGRLWNHGPLHAYEEDLVVVVVVGRTMYYILDKEMPFVLFGGVSCIAQYIFWYLL